MPPPLPPGKATSISSRKLILGLILAGSVVAFFLILFLGAIALVREAAPGTPAAMAVYMVRVAHGIAHHIAQHHHR